MGELAILFAIFCVGHSLAVVIRENGRLQPTPWMARQNGINRFWAFASGLAALGFGIAGAVT